MNQEPIIVKADGTKEPFEPARLSESLRRAGAPTYTANGIAKTVATNVVPGTSSKEIYTRAFALLRKETRPVAARYALRRALLELGPSGHPFEDFVSHLFAKNGSKVETRKMMQGVCVMHEVDFYAVSDHSAVAAELKYHNDPAYKTDLKTVLYVKSRFDDIFLCDPHDRTCNIDQGLLVTNTKFTTEAIKYAECAGVDLLGWRYPERDNLFARMTQTRVYPVTTLTTLTRAEKRLLIDRGVIAVDMLRERRDTLSELRMDAEHIGEVLVEADGLLALPHPFEG